MMFIYKLVIRLYVFAIRMASLFHGKAGLWIRGRRDVFSRVRKAIIPGKPVIWVHCASLGEFEQGRPVIEEIRKRKPGHQILLSFFSPSGYEIRKNYQGADHVFYLPADTQENAEKWVSLIKPEFAVFVKYEFWFHYMTALSSNKIPLYLVSGKFRSGQLFFRWYGKRFAAALNAFEHFFVQDTISAALLAGLGLVNTTVTGDTRFDRVWEISQTYREIPIADTFSRSHHVVVAGSTWPNDESILARYINNAPENIRLIIAPHEIGEGRISKLTERLRVPHTRFSKATEELLISSRVLVIDNIGMLSSLYRYGMVSYVGGGFGKGIHNILEAAAFGVPVVFGPRYYKFREAADLINFGGAFSINSFSQFQDLMNKLIVNNEMLKTSGEISRNYVKSGLGATKMIVDKLIKS